MERFWNEEGEEKKSRRKRKRIRIGRYDKERVKGKTRKKRRE